MLWHRNTLVEYFEFIYLGYAPRQGHVQTFLFLFSPLRFREGGEDGFQRMKLMLMMTPVAIMLVDISG